MCRGPRPPPYKHAEVVCGPIGALSTDHAATYQQLRISLEAGVKLHGELLIYPATSSGTFRGLTV